MTAQVEDKTSDERLRQLVEALGDLPGIILLSLRTGKSTSNLREGRRVDQFSVDFDVDVLAGGWRSLNILIFATSQADDFDNLSVRAWPNTDEPTDCLSFRLRGSRGRTLTNSRKPSNACSKVTIRATMNRAGTKAAEPAIRRASLGSLGNSRV